VERVNVVGVTFDTSSNSPLVILRDMEEKRILPIIIGAFEANAIMAELEGVRPTRPMTHDLFKLVVGSLGAKISKVVITTIKEDTFYAEIHISIEKMTTKVDSRPSDAIAIALRVGCPIFVEDSVLEHGQWLDEEGLTEEEKEEQFKNFIKGLKPEDFYDFGE